MFDRSEEGNERGREMAPEPYSFLPASRSALIDPPDPPTGGWWRDPFDSTGVYQRYYDAKQWTPYVQPHHRPPAVEYNPGPLRTGRSFAVAMAALFGGIVLLVLSAELDHQGTLSDWLVLIFGAGLVTLRDPVLRALWLR